MIVNERVKVTVCR